MIHSTLDNIAYNYSAHARIFFPASNKEKSIKKKLDECRDVFLACKKYEDQSIAYVAKCKTSDTSLKATLSSLYQAKLKMEAVNSKGRIHLLLSYSTH